MLAKIGSIEKMPTPDLVAMLNLDESEIEALRIQIDVMGKKGSKDQMMMKEALQRRVVVVREELGKRKL
jgi:hypothetical protein